MPATIVPPSHSNASERELELAALIVLLRAGTFPVDRIAGLAEEIGSAIDLVRALDAGEFATAAGELALGDSGPLEAQLEGARAEVNEWLSTGLEVYSVFDPEYPSNLRDVGNRPPFIFVRGNWRDRLDSRAIAVVGTRRASPEGLGRAAKIARRLAENGITVLSGLAAGIDAAAHRAALSVGGRTSAVLGTGIRSAIYPSENDSLAREILRADAGVLFSQFLPDQPPTKWTFPKRNVVMSALSWATVVVEASVTSGARVQAKEALKHGRTVFLLGSLVAEHDWAKKYVREGIGGVRAVMVESIPELLDQINGEVFPHDAG